MYWQKGWVELAKKLESEAHHQWFPFKALLYTVTDVKDLHEWMVTHLSAHSSFERITEAEEKSDILHDKLLNRSEEAQKVERNQGEKFLAIFRRL